MRRRRGQETIESRLRRLERWLGVPGRSSDAWDRISRVTLDGKIIADSIYDEVTAISRGVQILSFYLPSGEPLYNIPSSDTPEPGDTICVSTPEGRVSGVVGQVVRHYDAISLREYSCTAVYLLEGSIRVDPLQPHELARLERLAQLAAEYSEGEDE